MSNGSAGGSHAQVLEAEIRTAQEQGDWARLFALCGALLTQKGGDTKTLTKALAQAATRLIEQQVPGDLEAALGWATTWSRLVRGDEAKEAVRGLQQRIAAVRDCEQRLRQALAVPGTANIVGILTQFDQRPDRCPSTAPLIAEARARLSERESSITTVRDQIEALLPHAIDQAAGLIARLQAVDPGLDTSEFAAELQRRLLTVDNLHRRLAAAIAAPALRPLSEAVAAVEISTDQRSDTAALVEKARLEATLRQELMQHHRATAAGSGERQLDLTVQALGEIEKLEPDGEDAARLATLRPRLAELRRWHQQLHDGLGDPRAAGFTKTLAALRASPEWLSDTQALLDHAEEATRNHTARIRRVKRGRASVAVATGVALVLALGLWWRDASARSAISEQTDPLEQLRLAEAYPDAGHLFYGAEIRAFATGLAETLDAKVFAAAAGAATPRGRADALAAYLKRPTAKRAAEAKKLLGTAEGEDDDGAFAAAKAVVDPAARTAALGDYLKGTTILAHAAEAKQAIAAAATEQDDRAWRAALAPTQPDQRIASLKAYVAAPGEHRHAAEAAEALRVAGQQIADARDQAGDEEAWRAAGADGDPAAVIARLDGYLSGSTRKAHQAEATARRAALIKAIDDQAWERARAGDQAATGLRQLEAYLQGGTSLAHADEARTRIAALQRTLDEQAWTTAAVTGSAVEVRERMRAYLAGGTVLAHRAEAERELRKVLDEIDRRVWDEATRKATPAERILALEAYLAGDTIRAFVGKSKETIAADLQTLTDAPAGDLATAPPAILVRLPAATLERLPGAALAQLPVEIQAKVKVQPPWSSQAGVDERGRWAVVAVGKKLSARFRYLFPGSVAIAGGVTLTLAKGVWLAEQECPQAIWSEVMGGVFSSNNPSLHEGAELPVDSATFVQCQEFAQKLGQRLSKDKPAPVVVRLPTGGEWRFAAFTAGDGVAALVRGTVSATTPPAATPAKGPVIAGQGDVDGWGLFHLADNVREWCQDALPDHDEPNHIRGGSWNAPATELDAATAAKPMVTAEDLGFRLVIEDAGK